MEDQKSSQNISKASLHLFTLILNHLKSVASMLHPCLILWVEAERSRATRASVSTTAHDSTACEPPKDASCGSDRTQRVALNDIEWTFPKTQKILMILMPSNATATNCYSTVMPAERTLSCEILLGSQSHRYA